MACAKCDEPAVMHAAYAGSHLCEWHFRDFVERRVRRRVRSDGLLGPAASPEAPETWVLGLSGGKDSAVLAQVLHETFAEDPRVEFVALTVHEGIEGYRDESLDAARALADDLGVRHEVVTYDDEFGVRMDDVAAEDPLDMAPCAYCGVFRRSVLARHATELGADKLLTGHNLDDEAETALMNLLEGDVRQMGSHYDASLGPFPGAPEDGPPPRGASTLLPRAKPLRDVPEKEVALYARLRGLPAHVRECPHASESFRGDLQDLLLELEADHPGTRHSILSGYEELAAMAAERYRDADEDTGTCEQCGAPASGDVCRACGLLEAL